MWNDKMSRNKLILNYKVPLFAAKKIVEINDCNTIRSSSFSQVKLFDWKTIWNKICVEFIFLYFIKKENLVWFAKCWNNCRYICFATVCFPFMQIYLIVILQRILLIFLILDDLNLHHSSILNLIWKKYFFQINLFVIFNVIFKGAKSVFICRSQTEPENKFLISYFSYLEFLNSE
jgi:hypothetical protein